MQIFRYQIVSVNLNPTIGSEISKIRPCLVISPDEMNRNLRTIIVAPITSNGKGYPTRVPIKNTQIEGWVAIDQIRTIDRNRIINDFGSIDSVQINHVKNIIQETFLF